MPGTTNILNFSARATLILSLLFSSACTGDVEYLEPATDSEFVPGQVWQFKTRPGEENALLVVGKIDRAPDVGRIVHIKMVGLSLKNPNVQGGIVNVLTHLPVQEETLLKSVTSQVDTTIALDGFEGGYNNWLDAYDSNRLVVYSRPLTETLRQIEQSVNP